jgi:hypothetical protein
VPTGDEGDGGAIDCGDKPCMSKLPTPGSDDEEGRMKRLLA